MYYAAINSYATETSIGFCNTWGVIGFATKQTRDAYVRQASDQATKEIKASEIRNYNGKPGQIDHFDAEGNHRMHTGDGQFFTDPGYTIDVVTGIVSRHF